MPEEGMRDLTKDQSPQETYLEHLFPAESTELLKQAREAALDFGKSAISLSPLECRLMAALIRSHACQRFVEIGTLTGVSALWILSALPEDGMLWTLEKDLDHAQVAKDILLQYQKANPNQKVEVIEGDAQETLKNLASQGPFDGIFIDGNKSAYGKYLDWAEKNLRKGALILADNVFLGGSIFTGNTAHFSKKQIEVMKNFNQRLADPQKYFSAMIPTGEGLFVAIKLF